MKPELPFPAHEESVFEWFAAWMHKREQAARVWSPTQGEIHAIRNGTLQEYQAKTLDELTRLPYIVKRKLHQINRELRQAYRQDPQDAEVYAHFVVDHMVGPTLRRAFESHKRFESHKKREDIADFATWFDVGDSAYTLLGGIFMAAEAKRGDLDEKVNKLIKARSKYDRHDSLISNVEDYTRAHARAKQAQELLAADSSGSGFSVLEEQLKQLKAQRHGTGFMKIHPYQIPEFVLIGAETAEKVYKAAWNLPK